MPKLPLEVAYCLSWCIVLIPLAGALLACCWARQLAKALEKLLIVCSLIPFLFALALYPLVFQQGVLIKTSFALLLSGLRFQVDTLGLFFVFFTSLIWTLASIYSGAYLHSLNGYKRYATAWLLALSGNLGLVLAEDLFTFFIFFELLSLSAYFLIIHNQDEAAWKAGHKYLCLSIGGGLLLLWGILIINKYTDSLQWATLWQTQYIPPFKWRLAIGLILAGLGVKAGLMPLHVWLPDAHPAAPTPASALLSGVMIKAGAYGMLRLAQGFLRAGPSPLGEQLGHVLLWLGLTSMLLGVILALLQSDAKRLLAYHSISQMGYIVLGIGMCLYWGTREAWAGSLYHTINHALFKSALFLIVGVIYWHSGKTNLKQLGGWGKTLPALFACALIASAGISGLPPFNGYISKTLLHVSLAEGLASPWKGELETMKVLFLITGAGTLASFIKFIIFIFILPPAEKQNTCRPTPWKMQAPIIVLSALILLGGIFPYFWLKNLISPAMGLKNMTPVFAKIHFWALAELSGVGWYILLGGSVFGLAFYTKFFHHHWPSWPLVDCAYRHLGRSGLYFMDQVGELSKVLRNVGERGAELAYISYQHCLELYSQEKQTLLEYYHNLDTKVSQMSTRAIDYAHWLELEMEEEEHHLVESLEHLQQNNLLANLWKAGQQLPSKLLVNLSACLEHLKTWLIKKGREYQPLEQEGTEEITLEEALRYLLHFFNSDLSWGTFFILLVLLLYLFPLIWGW